MLKKRSAGIALRLPGPLRNPFHAIPETLIPRTDSDAMPPGGIHDHQYELLLRLLDDQIKDAPCVRFPLSQQIHKRGGAFGLGGRSFASEEAASEAGQRFEEVFMIALAKGRIGADFGYRAPKNSFTQHGLRAFFPPGERVSLNNVHGLMVYPSEPKPQFVAYGPLSLNRGVTVEAFHAEFFVAEERSRKLTDRERLAFVLFNSSFFQPGADARFLLLTMAIEALIEPAQKSSKAIQLVDGFIKQTKESAVQRSEKDSLIGSLKWLRDEYISKAGQRLAKEKIGR